jgi:nucleotide-binding universal stress UspA family protein
MKNKIIVPTDLTEAGDHAIRQAVMIALKNNASLILLHILVDKESEDGKVSEKLQEAARKIESETGLECNVLIKEGSIFDVIPFVSCEGDYDLMVIGTHGIHGIRQKLMGADILKLVSKIKIPVLVVQPESVLRESFKRIILPVSSHDNFSVAIDATILLAKLFDTEVCLYSINKAGFDWPDQILKNIETATREFEKNGIRMIRTKEDQNVYSMGFAKQTINFASTSEADAICIITPSSKEYYYFAPADKEALVLNETHIPVHCTGGCL